MDLFLTLLIIAIVLAVAGLLFYMQKKHVSFSIRVLLALGAGVVYGLLLQFFFAPDSSVIQQSMDWVNILGTGYVRFLQMIVMPLIFISILSAFTRMTLTKI